LTGQFDLTGQPPALLCGLEIMGYFARINKIVIFDSFSQDKKRHREFFNTP